jgi:radical SAM superfamily enzyme YgiQ (UPF0313 family)
VEFDTVLGSRGCPYKCKFCTFSLNPLGQKREYVARSPESVVDEIEASQGKIILFADDNFFVEPDRVERICDLLIERGIDKWYFANARLEVAKYPHMLEKAYRAGVRVLFLGIESASDRILKQLGKGFNTRQVRDAFTVLRRFPFFCHGFFMYGNVGETDEFARELGVHSIGLSLLRIDKFTPLRQLVESTPGYWISSRGHVYSQEFDRKRLVRIRNRIRNRFLFRPGQQLQDSHLPTDSAARLDNTFVPLGLRGSLQPQDLWPLTGQKFASPVFSEERSIGVPSPD